MRDGISSALAAGECIGVARSVGQEDTPCKRYEFMATMEDCRACLVEPEAKQRYRSRWIKRKQTTGEAPCLRRGPILGTHDKKCCGGKRHVEIKTILCGVRNAPVEETECWTCDAFEIGAAAP